MESVGLYIYCFAFSVIWLIYQDITQKKLKGVYFLVTLLLSIVFALLFPLNPFLPLFLAFFSLSLLANSTKTLCRHFFTVLSLLSLLIFLSEWLPFSFTQNCFNMISFKSLFQPGR